MQTRAMAKRRIGAYMAKKTRPYRMEAIAGVDLDAETEDKGTEIGIAAQGKWIILSKPCLNAFTSVPTAFLPRDGILIATNLDGSTAPAHVATGMRLCVRA
jgi:hypothetical protein